MVIGAGSRPQPCGPPPSSRARIGPPNTSWSGAPRDAREQGGQPARGRVDVIVDEHDKLAARRLAPGVAGRVQARRASQLEEVRAVPLGDRARASDRLRR